MIARFQPFTVRVGEANGDEYPISAEFQGISAEDKLSAERLPADEINQARTLGWVERGFQDRSFVQSFGGHLFRWLFPPSIDGFFRTAYEHASAEGDGLRLLLSLPSSLAGVPWELLYDKQGDGFLARSTSTPLVRHLSDVPLPHHPPKNPRLRILIVVASPQDLPPIASDPELRGIISRLARARAGWKERLRLAVEHFRLAGSPRALVQGWRQAGLVRTDILSRPATRAALLQRLRAASSAEDGYHVVHIIAHGGADDAGGRIMLETEQREADPVSAAELAELVSQESVCLVVLNACQTAAGTDLFNGIAGAILRRRVPAVIGMQLPILQEVAIEFARAFYGAWADGEPIESALALARRLMISVAPAPSADWGIPVLYMGPNEGPRVALPARPSARRQIATRLGWVAFTGVPGVLAWSVLVPVAFPPRPEVMTGVFNVVVADFGEQPGQERPVGPSEGGKLLSDQLFAQMEGLRRQDADLSVVQLQHNRIGFVEGTTPRARERSARELADQLNATMVVYGTLDVGRPPYRLAPALYVTERFKGGGELTGESAFGRPIQLTLGLNNESLMATASEIQPRLKALTYFTLGVAYLQVGLPDQALRYLKRADDEASAGAVKGEDLFHLFDLFRGSALLRRGGPDAYRQAADAYRAALAARPDYPRSYIGLGNVGYAEAVNRNPKALHLLPQAIDQYERALAADEKERALRANEQPAVTHVALKAHYNIGLAQTQQAIFDPSPTRACSVDQAAASLEQALADYRETPDVSLAQELGAKAEYQLGLLHESCGDRRRTVDDVAAARMHYGDAATHYERSIAIATPQPVRTFGPLGLPFGGRSSLVQEWSWQRDRWIASLKLADARAVLAELGDPSGFDGAIGLYQDLVGLYKRGGSSIPDAVAATAYYHLGMAHEKRNETVPARDAYQQVLAIESPNSEVRRGAETRLRALATGEGG